MREYVVMGFAVALALGPVAASAALGDIVGSFPGPDPNLRGLGRSTTYLYVLGLTSRDSVYRCNPTTGSVYNSWPTPYITENRGLAVTWGDHAWVGCYRNNFVYECAGVNGSVYGSWDAGHDPFGLAPLCTGDGGQGTTALFSYDTDPNFVYAHNLTNGSIIRSFPLAHATPYDFAYDHRNRLLWKYHSPNVYGYDRSTGSVIASFPRPYPSTCYGLAYYAEYLWISARDGNIFIVHCPGDVGVLPSSLGRVKALFK
jgi:hypothetical protein